MNRVTVTAGIAWLVAALLLWFMIKMDSDDLRWLQNGMVEPSVKAAEERPASQAATPVTLSCELTENALRDRVDISKNCASDSDCTLFDFGYPMDCMTAVAKSEITALRLDYRRYEENCEFRVYFDCPSEPVRRRAMCQANQCRVALQTNDALEEATLEYLGVGKTTQDK